MKSTGLLLNQLLPKAGRVLAELLHSLQQLGLFLTKFLFGQKSSVFELTKFLDLRNEVGLI